MSDRPPLPPFTPETAAQKVQAAEDDRVVPLAYGLSDRLRQAGRVVEGVARPDLHPEG